MIVNGKKYEQYVMLTNDLRIRNTAETWEDYLKPDGWINFRKLDEERKELFICAFTGYGTGKTWGLSHYVLDDKNENLGVVSNTQSGAEIEVESIISSFLVDGEDQFEGWEIANGEARDASEELRIRGVGLRAKGNAKRGRDFYTPIVLYDEFNQGNEQAEIKGQDPLKTLDVIFKRWSNNTNHLLRHCFMFGNKDGRRNMLSVKIMESLGIYGLSEYTECFVVERRIQGTNFWNPHVFVMNPKIDEEKQNAAIEKWIADPIRYNVELSALISGSAQIGMFNDDSDSWIFDNIYFRFKEDHEDLITKTWYLFQSEDMWFEFNLLRIPNSLHQQIYICKYEGTPDSRSLYSWSIPKQDGIYPLSRLTKDEIVTAISTNVILYDKIATKVQFLQNFIK